jgi:hypothetical protein
MRSLKTDTLDVSLPLEWSSKVEAYVRRRKKAVYMLYIYLLYIFSASLRNLILFQQSIFLRRCLFSLG